MRFTRAFRLGDTYTLNALTERAGGPRRQSAEAKSTPRKGGRKINLLIDIQAKLDAGKGAGYERWAKVFNLKEAAKTARQEMITYQTARQNVDKILGLDSPEQAQGQKRTR